MRNRIGCAVLLAAGTAFGGTVTVRPADDGRALVNPDMGWTMNYYSNIPWTYGEFIEPGDSLDWYPGCSVVYLRVPWCYVEPEEGVYNWAAFDSVAQRWIERGGQVAFRVTASESWVRYATPEWVKDAGAKGVNYNFGFWNQGGVTPDGKLWDPDFGDPVFLEKLDNFLRAFAARYDGRPEVAFVDIGSYGMWGEGHTHGSSRVAQEKRLVDTKKHIDLYCKHFKRTQLVISDDYDGHKNLTGPYPILDYARAKGVTLRDDSILVNKAPNQWYHANLADRYWKTMPVVVEHEHLRLSVPSGAWSNELLVESVEAYHASYMTIHHDPKRELEILGTDTVARINRRLGYRFQAREVFWPDTIRVGDGGEAFAVGFSFANAGVAPCYRDAYPALTLKGPKGVVAVLADDGFNLRTLETAAPGKAEARRHEKTFRLGRWSAPTFDEGEYDVYVSVGKADGTPVYELPLPDGDGHRRYRLGKTRLVYPTPLTRHKLKP